MPVQKTEIILNFNKFTSTKKVGQLIYFLILIFSFRFFVVVESGILDKHPGSATENTLAIAEYNFTHFDH